MNEQVRQTIAGMMNCFPQTNQNYEVLLLTLGRLCAGLGDQAIIEAAERFASGDVPGQSKRFAPSGPEFVDEARRRQELADIKARPRLPAPKYFPGPLPPFQIRQQKRLSGFSSRQALFENISYDQWRKMSASKEVPVGAVWCASLGIVFGPNPQQHLVAAE